MSLHATPISRNNGGYSKRLPYTGTHHQTPPLTLNRRKGQDSCHTSQVSSRIFAVSRRATPDQPNEGYFDRESVLGMVSAENSGLDYDPDSEIENNDPEPASGCLSISGRSQFT